MKYIQLSVGPLMTNCYLVCDDEGRTAVIDPGADAQRIRDTLARQGATLCAVLLTHAHFDHIGAVAALTDGTDIPVYCHRADIPALTDARHNLAAFFGLPTAPVTRAVAVEDGATVTVGDLCFTVLHTPGHTPGGVCYRLGEWLFAGDTLFCESVGRTDLIGGDARVLRRSLDRLLTLDGDAQVLPGHGEATTLSHERQYNPFI